MPKKPTYEELEQRVQELENAFSEHKQPEDQLLDNRRLLSALIENSGNLIVIKDCEGKNRLVNRKWEELTGLKRESVLGKTDEMLFPAKSARQFRKNDLRVIESGSIVETEDFLDTPSGTRYFISNKFPLINDDKKILGLCGIITDITDRKRAEDALRANEKIYRSTLNDLLVGVVVHANDSGILFSNPEASNILGLTYNQMIGKRAIDPSWDFVQENSSIMKVEDYPVSKVLSLKKSIHNCVLGIKRPDRDYVTWVIVNAVPVFSMDNELDKVIVNFVEITGLKQAEYSLRESEDRFKALHNASFGGISIHDKGIILECNQGMSEITGYSLTELIGMDGLLLIAEKSRDAVMNNILSGYEKPYEAIGLRKNGEEFPVRIEARNIPYKGMTVRTVEFRDITENKQAEEEREKLQAQLTQAQKMESVGLLAGGIAHDFNNILSAIFGFTELALIDIDKDSETYTHLQEVMNAGIRAKDLVKQILDYSRKSNQEKKPFKVSILIEEVRKMLRSTIPTNIDIYVDDQTTRSIVSADASQIHQVLINICMNAAHAMERDGGTLEIGLYNLNMRKNDVEHIPNLLPGDYLKLSISDTGSGIAKAIINQIFDPYFTTKNKGKGTGLGLAVVHGIVKSHNGHINVYSELGKGTTFNVYLPLINETEGHVSGKKDKTVSTGDERILFVDDEISIIKIQQQSLKLFGYRVLATTSSLEALEIFKKAPDEIDLVITDMTMPHMTGDSLIREIKKIRPDIPVILCTGFSEKITQQTAAGLQADQLLMKPVDRASLSKAIRKALDDAKGFV